MRRLAIFLALALLPAATAVAQKKPKPQQPYQVPGITIKATPNPTVHGTPIRVTGDVAGVKDGVTVRLQARRYNATTFTTVSTGKTGKNGSYSLGHRPVVNTYYRTQADTQPARQSAELLVRVRTLVGFRVSDSTPAVGQRVRFSGIVRPVHTGRLAYIQKKSTAGKWVTVARTRLRALDSRSSRYRRVLRVRRSGTYRVRVLGHADHAMGISRERTLTVH
jgi:hypothetical protein